MRVVKVVALLLGLGAIAGAAMGVVVLFALMLAKGPSPFVDAEVLGAAALFGAAIGALTGPPIAFVFLRRVPLWRATVEVAAAAGLGTTIGILAKTEYWPAYGLALAIAMALWLRRRYRNVAPARAAVDIE